MVQNRFDQSAIFRFLDAFVRDRKKATLTMGAVTSVLGGAVERNFAFEPLRAADLEPLREALQTLVGFTVREIRVVPLEKIFERIPDETEEARGERIASVTGEIEDSHVDMDEILGIFEPYLELVPEATQEALGDALDAAFKGVEPTHEDPLYLETIEGMAETFVYVPMLTLCAAALGDEVMYARAAGFLPWLSRCLPIGPLRDKPDVFTVVTTHALS